MAESIVHYRQQKHFKHFLRRFNLGQTFNWKLKLTSGKPIRFEIMGNHKNDNFLNCDWFKNPLILLYYLPNYTEWRELRNFPTKFAVKFTTSLRSSRFDWQLRNEIAKFVANFGNFKRTSEIVCQKFCNTQNTRDLGTGVAKTRGYPAKSLWHGHYQYYKQVN